MISIQIANGNLDVGSDQTIELQTTNIRFADGLREPYTNDFELPKTVNNITLLECYNLLDSPNQLYGTQLKPAVLTCDGYMMDCYLQVVSVNDDSISVCLYESTFPPEIRDKKIKDILHDTDDNIWVWSVNSANAYPSVFKTYDYGSRYNNKYAQYHAIRPMNTVIDELSAEIGYTLPHTDIDLGLLAQNKYVCPENRRQMIEFTMKNNGNELVMVGGQHIVNDMEGWDGLSKVGDSDFTPITFNRDCKARLTAYISWGRKQTTGLNTFLVSLFRNGVFEYSWQFNVTSGVGKRNGYVTSTINLTIHEGDTFHLRIDSPTTTNAPQKLELLAGVLDFYYTDYAITEDDYGTELVYCNRHPSLKQWAPTNTGYLEHPFDGRTETYYMYNWDGSRDLNSDFQMTFPWRGISYFGYYANISDITVGGLFYSLCWYMERGLRITPNSLTFVTCNNTKEIDGYVEETRPSSDSLGQHNYIIFNGQATNNDNVLTNINSVWLEPTRVLYESGFAYVTKNAIGIARIEQYNIKYKYDENGDTDVDLKYNEIDGTVVMRWPMNTPVNVNNALIPPHGLSDMGLREITAATEVTITTYDDEVTDKDYIYLDGRKFIVKDVTSDLHTKESTITALLVPTRPIIHDLDTPNSHQ